MKMKQNNERANKIEKKKQERNVLLRCDYEGDLGLPQSNAMYPPILARNRRAHTSSVCHAPAEGEGRDLGPALGVVVRSMKLELDQPTKILWWV